MLYSFNFLCHRSTTSPFVFSPGEKLIGEIFLGETNLVYDSSPLLGTSERISIFCPELSTPVTMCIGQIGNYIFQLSVYCWQN